MLMIRLAVIAGIGLMLAGCQTIGPASVKGGECRVFERPEYAVRGLRRYDQNWIDGNIEAGVGGCGWQRPKARPASFDAVPGQKANPAPVKKKTFVQRVKDLGVHPFTKPVAPVIESPPVAVMAPAPPPKPRDAVDELLQPSKDQRRFN